jgi:2',3'-cyclic-nucleotide 2'-phosphodiesterase
MPELLVAYFGDIVGSGGRDAVAHAIRTLRARHPAILCIANAENSKNGSGLSPDNLRELKRAGLVAMTLGDHCFKDRAITGALDDPGEPICRPANLADAAPGKRFVRLSVPGTRPLYVFSVLGRLFMPLPSDSPFVCVDRILASLPDQDAMVIVEIHAEATSEKQAMAHHCLARWCRDGAPRVVAVVGSHTHVQTADARILSHMLAALTDLGMCGPHDSVIGRSVADTLSAMVTQLPVPLGVADGDNRAKGCLLRIDADHRRAIAIELLDIPCP